MLSPSTGFGGTFRAFCSDRCVLESLSACVTGEAMQQLQAAYDHVCAAEESAVGLPCVKGWLKVAEEELDDSSHGAHELLSDIETLTQLICQVQPLQSSHSCGSVLVLVLYCPVFLTYRRSLSTHARRSTHNI